MPQPPHARRIATRMCVGSSMGAGRSPKPSHLVVGCIPRLTRKPTLLLFPSRSRRQRRARGFAFMSRKSDVTFVAEWVQLLQSAQYWVRVGGVGGRLLPSGPAETVDAVPKRRGSHDGCCQKPSASIAGVRGEEYRREAFGDRPVSVCLKRVDHRKLVPIVSVGLRGAA